MVFAIFMFILENQGKNIKRFKFRFAGCFSWGLYAVCAMQNTSPVIDSPELIRYIVNRSNECPIHIHPIGAVTKSQKGKELTEMKAMLNEEQWHLAMMECLLRIHLF